MKVIAYGDEFNCAKAIKGSDFIKLYDVDNNEIAVFGGINSFDGYEVLDGKWSEPEKTPEEKITELEKIVAELQGANKDIGGKINGNN